jgi:hypothetical protein
MYTIQLDKANNFECNIKIQGASIKKTKVNLVVECSDFSLKFKGSINEDGKINVPLSKLKGILDENVKGKLYLEVIAEDTYFTPYETEYLTEVSRKVEMISVNGKDKKSLVESRDADENISKKPIVTISNVKQDNSKLVLEHTKKIVKNIKNKNLSIYKSKDKTKVIKTIQSYLSENKINGVMNRNIMETLYKIISTPK